MKTNIKIVFKDNTEWVFDANTFGFEEDGFCRLDFVDEEDRGSLVACVSTSEIKYSMFVEVEE
ncbi:MULTISPECIES: hypothetical protein [Anaerococcus]|uniref:Conserved domain protein n=1 Tax=Anaerococcus hydrogenalis ACS-025-V-Sch4 TaxID=879306 RepID=F0H2E6_9FIRM|nr:MULTISPECIES: hypothetical protein [Anaerococcus]EGC83347.1 conserved domain protein [Anaerococcus hydrogenalis ACS-025-V-Sch4]MDU4026565.1 hypothetical protein [Anaerococcus sp.]